MSTKAKTTTPKPDGKPGLTPKLRFPEFRDAAGWDSDSLGSIFDTSSGGTPDRAKEEYWNGNIPWITTSLVGFNIITKADEFITDAGLSNSSAKLFPEKTILVAMYGQGKTRGQVAMLEIKAATNQACAAILPQKDIDPRFVFLNLGSRYEEMRRLSNSGGQENLSQGLIQGLQFSYPKDLAEQQRIADCLTSLDDLLDAQIQKLDALKTHKKGLMQQLFPREGETQPRLRFPEFQNAGEWAKMTLGQAATFYNGRAYKQEELLESGKYLVLRVGNFFTSNTWYYSDLELDETKYCEKGDLLYAWSASFGPRIWRGERSIYHYHIWKVIEQRGIDKQFLFITLENETENMKTKTTNGLGIMHITKGAIESWESTFPTMAEQRKIAGCLTSLDNTITAEMEKLDALKTHKDGLMQQLFPSPEAIQS